jgi:hypothetical protein
VKIFENFDIAQYTQNTVLPTHIMTRKLCGYVAKGLTNPSFRSHLPITSIVKHTERSLCEGYPTKYRVMMDQYLGFVPQQECFSVNYLGH